MKRVENPLAPESVADLCIIVVEDTRRDEVQGVTRAVLAVRNCVDSITQTRGFESAELLYVRLTPKLTNYICA